MVPVELSGGTKFPVITERPYFLNLAPFGFYWFALQREVAAEIAKEEAPLIGAKTWEEVFSARNRDALDHALRTYLPARRWFGAKARAITSLTIRDVVELANDRRLLLVDAEFSEGEAQTYVLPLCVMNVRREQDQTRVGPILARLRDGAILYEPIAEESFAHGLLDAIARKRQLRGRHGIVAGVPTRALRELRGDEKGDEKLETHVLSAEQSNTGITYGQRLFLKLFRRLEPGINTDYEVTRFLNEETSFRNVPRIAGALEYQSGRAEPMTVGVLQGFLPNSGDAWSYTLDAIGRFFDRLLSDAPAAEREAIGPYLADAELLGTRTAQLHLALASRDDIRAFAPEPFTPHYQRSIYQSMRTQVVQTLQLVRRRLKGDADAERLLAKENDLHQRMRAVLDGKIDAQRIRTHGDYHLGQVLRTGGDFVIIDFEGEPARPLSERRIKRSAIRDVAGMLRSFHYAPYAVLFGAAPGSAVRAEDLPQLEAGAAFWHRSVGDAFLRAYLAEGAKGKFLPSKPEHIDVLLNAYLLEKALYEIVYELNNRPDWVRIPLRGVLDLVS
jgi:maltose alpha-D-glucosyltransferase/alpha-amylase